MQTPVGPSLQLVLALADAFAEVSLSALEAVWKSQFDPKRLQRKLAQFETAGWLEKPSHRAGVERIVQLTAAGRLAALGGRDPERQWQRPWDGRWRMALFDVPEVKRALRVRLWRKLRALHFGCLQNSVWVTPDPVAPIRETLAGTPLNVETLTLMEARPCGGESTAALVQGAWDFARINRNYQRYLDVLGSEPKEPATRPWRNWFEVEWKAWTKAVRDDPLLPAALLPAGYLGQEAWRRRVTGRRRRFA